MGKAQRARQADSIRGCEPLLLDEKALDTV